MSLAKSDRGRAREEEILSAATELFGARGYRAVTLRDIAGRAGITHPTLLHYFPNKEALLDAVLSQRDATAEGRMATIRTLDEFFDAGREIAAENANQPDIIAFFTKTAAEATDESHPGHDFYKKRYADAVEAAARVFRDVAGELPAGLTPAEAAQLMLAIGDGIQLQWLYDPETVSIPAISDKVLHLLTGVDLSDD